MSTVNIDQLEKDIQKAREAVALGESLRTLLKNADFNKVINAGYFKELAIKLVHAKSAKDKQNPDDQRFILSQMDSIGALSEYFSDIRSDYVMAKKTLTDSEQTRDDLLKEGVINGR